MFSELFHYLSGLPLPDLGRDLLDVFITFYIFYRIALVLKGTRAMQIGIGLVGIFVVYVVAELLHLYTVLTLLGAVLSSAILIGVVVFQNDIRRGLMRVGAGARLGSGATLEAKVIDDVVEAATVLARHRIGALITFEQDANLDEFVGSHTGHTLDATVSSELLVSLFLPEGMNKLHDGAVVIRELRIAKAGVFFPMPEGRVSDQSFGSRHRAAMGITEETDAVVIVVSEERGAISFCFNGNIVPNLDGPRLRAALDAVFAPKRKEKERRPGFWSRWFGPRPVPADRHSAPPLARTTVDAPSSLPRRAADTHSEPPPPEAAPRPLRKRPATSADGDESVRRPAPEVEPEHDPDARPSATGLKAARVDDPQVQPLRKNLDGSTKKSEPAPEGLRPKVESPRTSDSVDETPATRRTGPSEGEALRPMPRADETPRLPEATLEADRPSTEGVSQ